MAKEKKYTDQSIRRQNRFIVELMRSPTTKAACDAAKVARRTAENWLRDSDFQARLSKARREVYSKGILRLIGLVEKAITVIESCLDGEPMTKDRFLAAREVLSQSRDAQNADLSELSERLEKLLSKYEVIN